MELQIQNQNSYQSRYALQMQSLASPQFYSTQYQNNNSFPSSNMIIPMPYQAMPLAQSIPQQVSSQQFYPQHVANTPFLVQNYSQPIQQSPFVSSSNPFLPQPPQLKPTYQPVLNDVFPQKSSSLLDDSSLEMVNIKKKDEISSHSLTKKCLNCSIYYSEHLIQNIPNPCQYHPGNYMTTYQSPYISGASVGYWTCCKGAQKSLGCTKTKHKEDPVTTELQKLFGSPSQSVPTPPVKQESSTAVGVLVDWGTETDTTTYNKQQTSNKPTNKTNLLDYDTHSKDTKYISHYVNDNDTLTGLALKYRTSVAAIRKVNRITVDDIRAYSRLLIPKDDSYTDKSSIREDEIEECDESNMTEEEKKLREKRSIHQFMKRAGTSENEAKYYLGLHEYSLKRALEELKDDIEFERKTPFRSVARKCK